MTDARCGCARSVTSPHTSIQGVTLSILDLAIAIAEDLAHEDAARENSLPAADQVRVCRTAPR